MGKLDNKENSAPKGAANTTAKPDETSAPAAAGGGRKGGNWLQRNRFAGYERPPDSDDDMSSDKGKGKNQEAAAKEDAVKRVADLKKQREEADAKAKEAAAKAS